MKKLICLLMTVIMVLSMCPLSALAEGEFQEPLTQSDPEAQSSTVKSAEAGTDVNATDENGQTPLMFAAMNNTPEIVKSLLNAGANVKAKDKNGRKALDFARRNNKLKKSDVIGRLRG